MMELKSKDILTSVMSLVSKWKGIMQSKQKHENASALLSF